MISSGVQECAAQAPTAYTDSKTNITFTTWSFTDSGGMTYGMALPEDALTKDATEYIGILVSPLFRLPEKDMEANNFRSDAQTPVVAGVDCRMAHPAR